ncbi:MAG: hypothetical protein ACE5KT_02875 [Methanosarcinales archaeon]
MKEITEEEMLAEINKNKRVREIGNLLEGTLLKTLYLKELREKELREKLESTIDN